RPAMRGDLLAVMETIVMRVEDAEKRGDTEAVDRLAGEYEEARAEFEASRRVFVVEARSTHRRRELEKQLEKRGLVQKPGKKASEQEKQDYARTLMAHQLADQVVSPKGVTAEGIEKLLDVNEPALDLIFAAAQRANSQAAKAPVTPDFLRGR
ncbi:MAG TPA: hypothetical protein VK095_06420, partial [Beutenbergiaceae bacterium]|nr:hypothetical protein [Beutenbergiaceae bacterium]